MNDVPGKIEIVVCVGSTDVILFSECLSLCRKLLELRDDQLIAALAVPERTHVIMNSLPSVQTHDNIVHLAVAEFHDLVVQKNAVCRDRETEVLVMFFFK